MPQLSCNAFTMSLYYLVVCYIDYVALLRLYGSNVCGEGGEYETLTLDCPLFTVCLLSNLNDFEFMFL